MLFSCGIIFGGSRRDVGRYAKLRCSPANCVAMRCDVFTMYSIDCLRFNESPRSSRKMHFPLRFPPRRVEKRCVRRIVKYRSAELQLRFLPTLSPAFATDRFKVSVARRRRNYNIPADTCARLTAQLPARECFSRMGGKHRYRSIRRRGAVAAEISAVDPCFNESRVSRFMPPELHGACPPPLSACTRPTIAHKILRRPSILLARSIERGRSNNCNFTLAW